MNAAPPRGEDGTGRRKTTAAYDTHCLHPGDLITYTRKPLFLVLDSPTAAGFKVSD